MDDEATRAWLREQASALDALAAKQRASTNALTRATGDANAAIAGAHHRYADTRPSPKVTSRLDWYRRPTRRGDWLGVCGPYPLAYLDTLRRELDGIAGLGIRIVRGDVAWSALEPAAGTYRPELWAPWITEVIGRDMVPLPLFTYAPNWAHPGQDGDHYPPSPSEAWRYGAAARAFCAFYADRLCLIEGWNEPNLAEFWRPMPNSFRLGVLQAELYGAAKATLPESVVISAATAPSPTLAQDFFTAALGPRTTGRWAYDAVGHHAYCFPADPWATENYDQPWNALAFQPRALAAAAGMARGQTTRVWATETGTPVGDTITEAVQGDRLRTDLDRWFDWQDQGWAGPWIVYAWRDGHGGRFGLCRDDGTLRPAAIALEALAANPWTGGT